MPAFPDDPFSRRTVLTLLACMPSLVRASPPSVAAESAPAPRPVASETVLSIRRIGTIDQDDAWVCSRITLPAGAQWKTDPDRGPLTMRLLTGEVIVTLAGGAARVERRYDLFLRPEIVPFPTGIPVTLVRGDQLVVVRGCQLTVFNDSEESASAIVSRLTAASDGAS